MLYRVVLQGVAAPGSDVGVVKREFMRVTALPQDVAEKLFDGTAKVLKRELTEADAERIAGTLRAIGAPATVEPEPAPVTGIAVGSGVVTPPGTSKIPLATPTFSPATSRKEAPDESETERRPRRRGMSRRGMLWLAGTGFVLVALLAAPAYDEWVRRVRGPKTALMQSPAKEPEAAAAPEPRVFKASSLEGPWRCTDQSNGVSTYWDYRPDGTLRFFGDNTSRTERPQTGPGIPTRWSLEGDRLTLAYESKPPLRLTLIELTLVRLDYRNPSLDEVRCLRP